MAHASSVGDFEIRAPAAWTAPAVFNSPHSGRAYPTEFLRMAKLTDRALRKSEDCYIDELFAGCLQHGAPLLVAHVPRSFIDLNREPYELDPRMFSGPLPGYINATSPRVGAGLGTIPRIVSEGEEIYSARLPVAEALTRIERVYRPYHRTLSALIEEVHGKHGSVLLVDCHSMPSSAASHLSPSPPVDIVLGDRFGASCSEDVTQYLEELLCKRGFRVLRNKPYAGGFITLSHGSPNLGRHALQIEVNRALYIDEEALKKSPSFETLRLALTEVLGNLLSSLAELIGPARLAAE